MPSNTHGTNGSSGTGSGGTAKSAARGSNGASANGHGADPDIAAQRRDEQKKRTALVSAELRERQLIGAALFDVQTCREMRDTLTPNDFITHICRSAFCAILAELETDPEGITILAVARRMQRERMELSDGKEAEWLEQCRLGSPGGAAALIEARAIEDARKKAEVLARVSEVLGTTTISGSYAEVCTKLSIAVGGFQAGADILTGTKVQTPRFLAPNDTRDSDKDVYLHDVFPPWFADFASECSHSTETTLDSCVQGGIAAISSAIAPWFNVSAKVDWVVPCLLWTICAIPSGGGKSPAMDKMFSVRDHYERKLIDDRKREISVLRVRAAAKKKLVTNMRKRVEESEVALDEYRRRAAQSQTSYGFNSRQADDANNIFAEEQKRHDELLFGLAQLEREVETLSESQVLPKVFITSPTPESFWSQTPFNPGNYACVIDDEGDIFDAMVRYTEGGKSANEAVFLGGFDGRTHFPGRSQEPGKPSRFANLGPHTRIELHQMIQNPKFISIGQKGGFNDKGFVNRFLFFWPTKIHMGKPTRDVINSDIRDEYLSRMGEYFTDTIDWQRREAHEAFPRVVRLFEKAAEEFHDWRIGFKPRFAHKNGDLYHIGGWASKFPSTIMKLAMLLEVLWSEDRIESFLDPSRTISVESLRRALRLAPYFIAHALYTFNQIGGSSTEPSHDAEMMMRALSQRGKATYTAVELQRYMKWDARTQYMNEHQVQRAVKYLIQEGIMDSKHTGKEVAYHLRVSGSGRRGRLLGAPRPA